MINSRSLEELNIDVQIKAEAFIRECDARGVPVLVTSTFRDKESQDALYALGRTTPGKIVTNARGGESFHQYRLAFDCYPMIGGKPLWEVFDSAGKLFPAWEVMKEAAGSAKLEWAGDWIHFKEYAHFQDSQGLTVKQLQEKYPTGVA